MQIQRSVADATSAAADDLRASTTEEIPTTLSIKGTWQIGEWHMETRSAECVEPYLKAIRELAPLIAQERGSFDRERRVSPHVFDALSQAGLFRTWLAKTLGGPELSPIEFMTVVEAAAACDGSVGWLVGNGDGMSRAGGYLPQPIAREWFGEAKAFIASSTA